MRIVLSLLVVSLVGCAAPSSTSVSPIAPSVPEASIGSASPGPIRAVAPDSVLVDLFSGQLDRAMRKAFRQQPNAGLRAIASDLVVVPISSRAPGTYVFPNPGGNQVSVPLDATLAEFTLNIAPADKSATGKTLSWSFYFSSDNGQTWVFRIGGGWQSYGPNGYTDPSTGTLNPDPFIRVGISDRRGQLIRGELVVPQAIDLGVTISVQ